MQDNDERLGTRHPIKPAVMGFPADKVTCRMQTFECSLLRPLEYICLFNFVARSFPQGVISSQSRYDHFDTAPYLSQHQHLGKRGELMGRTSKNIKLRIPEKPHKIKGFRSGSYRVATTISSAPSYDLLGNAPCSGFLPDTKLV